MKTGKHLETTYIEKSPTFRIYTLEFEELTIECSGIVSKQYEQYYEDSEIEVEYIEFDDIEAFDREGDIVAINYEEADVIINQYYNK